MLVIVTTDRIIPPQQVCQACLLADDEGKPRWRQGTLCCARAMTDNPQSAIPIAYECQMGFKLIDIDRDC
jgi:hypothetical protein